MKIFDKSVKFGNEEIPFVDNWEQTKSKVEEPAEETTIEVTTRPFEVDRISRTVQITREPKTIIKEEKIKDEPDSIQFIEEIIEQPEEVNRRVSKKEHSQILVFSEFVFRFFTGKESIRRNKSSRFVIFFISINKNEGCR